MKNCICVLIAICIALISCTENKSPEPNQNQEQTETTDTTSAAKPEPPLTGIPTPAGFEVLGFASGDLDKDDIEEKVIVFNTPRQTDFGTERELHIYKKENSGWKLWHQSVGVVMSSESGGVMGEPFEEVKIENGSIALYHFGGSRQKWSYTHRFRFQNGSFQLIGATVSYGSPCDYFEDFDYNLSTGKINYKKTTEDCEASEENPVTKVTEKSFTRKLEKLPSIDAFRPGESEVSFPGTEITFYF